MYKYIYIFDSWKVKGDVWKENNEQTKNKREERRHILLVFLGLKEGEGV